MRWFASRRGGFKLRWLLVGGKVYMDSRFYQTKWFGRGILVCDLTTYPLSHCRSTHSLGRGWYSVSRPERLNLRYGNGDGIVSAIAIYLVRKDSNGKVNLFTRLLL